MDKGGGHISKGRARLRALLSLLGSLFREAPMDPSTYARIQTIVDAVLDAEVSRRSEVLEQLCVGDAALRAEVDAILSHAGEGHGAFSEEEVTAQRENLNAAFDGARSPQTVEAWRPDYVGDYKILEPIGAGGTGVVFRAQQQNPKRHVALKLLSPGSATVQTMERLQREAQILGRLHDPGIAAIYEAGVFNGGFGEQPFIAMELVDGPTVVEYARRQELDRRGRIGLIARTLDAVEHAHGQGIVHRDLKPDNILVHANGQPKVLDFGIAKVVSETLTGGLTSQGQILGTVAYMPPEQATGREATGAAADVYSMGAVAFELLTGKRPREVDGLSLTEILRELSETPTPSARNVDPTIETDLETILAKAMDERPRHRYDSAAMFATDLRRFLEHRPISARPAGAVDWGVKFVRRHRALSAGALAVLLVLVGGIASTLRQSQRANTAERAAQSRLYAAEMLLATGDVMRPTSRGRSDAIVQRWAPGSAIAEAVDGAGELRWEWHLLNSVRRAQTVTVQCTAPPMGMDWHPDGELIAVAMEAGVGVYDAATGHALTERFFSDELQIGLLLDLWWSPNGDRIAVAGVQGLLVWEPFGSAEDVRTGSNQGPPRGRVVAVNRDSEQRALTWTPDGKQLIGVCEEATLYDAENGRVLSRTEETFIGLDVVELDPAGGGFLAARRDGLLCILAPGSGALQRTIGPYPSALSSLSLEPLHRRLALVGFDREVNTVDFETGEPLWSFGGAEDAMFHCDWSPDGLTLSAASKDGAVRLLDGATGQEIGLFSEHVRPVRDVGWSSDGKRCASVGHGSKVLVWDAQELSAVRRFWPLGKSPWYVEGERLSWVSEHRRLWVGHESQTRSWDWDADRPTAENDVPALSRVSGDGTRAIYIEREHEVVLWSVTEEREIGRTVLGQDSLSQVAWCGVGVDSLGPTRFAAANRNGLYLVEVPSGEVSGPFPLVDDMQYLGLECSPDGSSVCAVSTYEWAAIAPVHATGAGAPVTFRVPDGARMQCVDWSPDSSSVVAGTSDGLLRIVSAAEGKSLMDMVGHAGSVTAVSWHPSGDRIASASRDRTVKLWRRSTGTLVASFLLTKTPADLLWVDQGKALVAIDFEGGVTVWDASRSLRPR